MRRTWCRRLSVASVLTLLLAGLVSGTTAGAHPNGPGGQHNGNDPSGIGVRVNAPPGLAGFRPATQWSGTAPVDNQTTGLVYAGTGCTPAHYAGLDVEGKIALVDDAEGKDPGDLCQPTYTFKQKMEAAEQAGAIGLVQVEETDEVFEGNAIASGIPGLALPNSLGVPIRDAVIAGEPVNVTLLDTRPRLELPAERLSNVPCEDGRAGIFPCDGVDLLAYVPLGEFQGEVDVRQVGRGGASDLWGWTDPKTGDEYVIIGKTNGVGLFRITDPTNPVYLGALPNRAAAQHIWHDIKVYDNHAFIVSESEPHGMQVFDLTRLRGVTQPQEWTEDALYPLPPAAHNLEINTATGYAYIVGGNAGLVAPDQCLSGLHMVDIRTPKQPVFAGCYLEEGGPGTLARSVGGPAEEVSPAAYVHDTQCVVYRGPDTRYTEREICFNSAENKVVIVDVTDKLDPVTLGVTDYPNVAYTHQGWLTDDQAYLLVNDELDEVTYETNTRTVVLDVTDLEKPRFHFAHMHDTRAITHNNYVHEGLVYQSNYTSGLRVLDTAFVGDPVAPRLEPVRFFDTFPAHDDPEFEGTWSNYPFFPSGTIAVSGIGEGLFLLRLATEGPAVELACADCPLRVRPGSSGSLRLTVRNAGGVDDTYRLGFEGLPAGWGVVADPMEVEVRRGAEAAVPVTIDVPATASARTYTFAVTATSSVDHHVTAWATLEVRVRGAVPSPGQRTSGANSSPAGGNGSSLQVAGDNTGVVQQEAANRSGFPVLPASAVVLVVLSALAVATVPRRFLS